MRILVCLLILLLGEGCTTPTTPKKSPFGHKKPKIVKGHSPFRLNQKSAKRNSKSSPSLLKGVTIVVQGRLIEVGQAFSDLAHPTLVVLIKKRVKGEVEERIINIDTNPNHWPQDQAKLREGKLYWWGLTSPTPRMYRLHHEKTRVFQQPKVAQYLSELGTPIRKKKDLNSVDLKRNLNLLRRGDPMGMGFFRDHGRETIRFLVKNLSKKDLHLAQAILLLVSRYPISSATEKIIPFRKSPHQALRLRAAIALGEIGTASSLKGLSTFAQDSHDEIREWVAYYLRFSSGNHAFLAPLVKLMDDSQSAVRRRAVRTLGILRLAAGIPALVNRLKKEKEEPIAQECIRALGRIGTPHALQLLFKIAQGRAPHRRNLALRAISYNRFQGVPYLIALLEHQDAYLSWRADYELRAITGMSFGFSPQATLKERKAILKKWQQWWKTQRKQLVDRKGPSR